ncbi:MAG: lactate utilization protein [Planctomycetota bacterium]
MNTPTAGESRATFLSRVQRALSAPGRSPSHHAADHTPPATAELARLVSPQADLPSLFAANSAKSGMHVHRVDKSAIVSTLSALLAQSPGAQVALAITDSVLRTLASQALQAAGNPGITWTAQQSARVWFDVDIAITDVTAAVAETGSLVLACSPLLPRAAFMVPPVHIALVRTSQILPDLLDLLAGDHSTPQGTLTIVSGPSKTADIEGILVTGVHGPGQLHVVLTP